MELLSSATPDHQFVVINRDPNSSLANIESWGKGAYIVDPWWQFIGPVSDYRLLMESRLNQKVQSSLKTLLKGQVGEGHSASWSTQLGENKNSSLMTAPVLSFEEKKKIKESIPFAQ